MVMSPTGLGSENYCAGEGQQQLLTTDLPSHQRGCYIRNTATSVQLENNITGRESQGVCTNMN
jgi:hypothetical protein